MIQNHFFPLLKLLIQISNLIFAAPSIIYVFGRVKILIHLGFSVVIVWCSFSHKRYSNKFILNRTLFSILFGNFWHFKGTF